jgi:MFS family permease
MASIMSIRILVSVLLGPVAGTFVDRADRRQLMLAMDLIRFGLVGLMAWLAAPGGSFWMIAALTALIAVGTQFFDPAMQASLVQIVSEEDLPRASSMLQTGNMLARVAGPLAGGVIVGYVGGQVGLAVDALTFLVSGMLILAGGYFASPRQEGSTGLSFWQEFREGFSYIGRQPLIRSIVILASTVNFFGYAVVMVLVPVIAIKIWNASQAEFGGIEASLSLGLAVGAAVLTTAANRIRRRGWLIVGGLALAGALFAATVRMPAITWALPLIGLAGFVLAVPNVLFQILLQAEVEPEMQGRVFGNLGSLMNVTIPGAMMLAGFLGDLFSPVLIATGCGLLLFVTALGAVLASPTLRHYN